MFPIFKNCEQIGTTRVEEKGLYYHFYCAIRPKTPGKYHIYLQSGKQTTNLGLCVPEKDEFILRTSIPIKNIPSQQMRFSAVLIPKCEEQYIVEAHRPFGQLMHLNNAYLAERDGQMLICFRATLNPPGSDLSR